MPATVRGGRVPERAGDGSPTPVLEWRGDAHEFLRRVSRSDAGAAALLYDRFADEVNRMVWRLLGADPEHDDVVNEVFLRVLRGVGKVRDPDKLRGWILSIAVNTARSELRKRSIRRKFIVSQPVEEPMSHVEDPEARALLQQTFAVLDGLPANLRVVFTLRYIDDLPLAEVAELCNCSLATVKRHLTRAEKRFVRAARRQPALDERLARSSRWSDS